MSPTQLIKNTLRSTMRMIHMPNIRAPWTAKSEEREKDIFWKKGSKLVNEIVSDASHWFSSHEREVAMCVALAPNALTCIDERAPKGVNKVATHGRVVSEGSAGCGILLHGVKEMLLENKEPSQEIQSFVSELKAKHIRRVFPHDQCGAAGVFAESVGEKNNAEKYSKLWAEKLASLLDGSVEAVAPVYPLGFHDARAIYFDLTADGRFSADEAPDTFPRGFHISESCLGMKEAIFEAGVAAKIAFGEHGFGKRFNETNPLLLVAIIGDSTNKESCMDDLKPLVDTYGLKLALRSVQVPTA